MSLAADHAQAPRILGLPEPWFFLAVGAATAPLFALTPIVQYMGWFLSSLTHEMGHATVGWFFGMPSIPAIRLDGHAAAFHVEQKLWIALVVWIALGLVAGRIASKRIRIAALVIVGTVYPLLAFTGARELFGLLGGHGGELIFACVCFWRALTGGFTSSPVERGLYGTLGWYLLAGNLILTTGLVFSDAARAAYGRNGSFGLTNDYLRVADDVLGVPVPVVAACMTVVALGVLPLAFVVARAGGSRV